MRKPKVCWKTTIAWDITLVQHGKDQFSVTYGLQVKHGNYSEMAHELGLCIMHALACEGRLDNRMKGER